MSSPLLSAPASSASGSTTSSPPGTGPEIALSATGIRRSYAHGSPLRRGRPTPFVAVRDVDVELRRGELFALLGTNGAGKTSLLEVLEGQVVPDAGSVRVLGRDPFTDARLVRPRIGMMLQEGGFPAGLTADEALTMWAGTLTTPRPISEALDLVGLIGRRHVAVRSLSGGERRRLDLALAILGRPEILFLDEPTTGLDPESRHAAWDLVGALLEGGTTVLLTTHYLEEAERLADRIAIMHAGRIAASGTLAEIVAGQPSMITFTVPAGISVSDLPALPDARPEVEDTTVSISTEQLQTTLFRLLTWAGDQHVLLGLDARSASLEQAFLAISQSSGRPAHQLANLTQES